MPNPTSRIHWVDAVAMPLWATFLAVHAALGPYAFLPPSEAAGVGFFAVWVVQEALSRIRTRSGHLEIVVMALRLYRIWTPRGRKEADSTSEG